MKNKIPEHQERWYIYKKYNIHIIEITEEEERQKTDAILKQQLLEFPPNNVRHQATDPDREHQAW